MKKSSFESTSSSMGLRVSTRKLSLLGDLVRNLKVLDAVKQLEFSKKRIAFDVKKCIMSCVSNAQNTYGLQIQDLFISQVFVGKSKVMKRIRPRARGRSARILKPFSNLYIKLNIIK